MTYSLLFRRASSVTLAASTFVVCVTTTAAAMTTTVAPSHLRPVQNPSSDSSFDRTKAPPVPPAKLLHLPAVQIRKLSNGIPVAVMEDHHVPIVSVVAVTDISSDLEPTDKTGLLSVVTPMLSEGTTIHTADQLADAFAELGNQVSPLGFYTIPANVDKSIDLMAEQLLTPAFPQAALDRIKANTAARIKRSQESPTYLASHVFADVLYGKDHPYSRIPTQQSVMSITREDVQSFYTTYFRPPNLKFVVVGDITPAQAVEKLDRVFGKLSTGKTGRVIPPAPAGVSSTTIYLYDRPNSPQSVIMAGSLAPREDTPDRYAIELMNTTFGGAFTSRLNLNLREQHQYTYGANSRVTFRRLPELGTIAASTAVVTSKTDSALIETVKELRDIRGPRPITPAEYDFAKGVAINGLPLKFETVRDRAGAVANLIGQDLPLDYYNKLAPNFNAVTLTQDQAAATKYIDPSKTAIVIVGDRSVIEPKLRATGIAPVVVVDSL